MDGGNELPNGSRIATDGEWAGWRNWAGDPFETQSGPYYYREEAGRIRCAFRAGRRHMNGGNFMHGGCLMTFADFALFAIAEGVLQNERAVTLSLNGEFIGMAREGDLIEATGEVVKSGKSVVFVRGLISTAGSPLLTFSGVLKKLGPRR